jgi:hypothetical protein
MTIEEFDQGSPGHLTTVLRRVSAPVKVARDGVGRLAARLPAAVRATGSRAQTAAQATRSGAQATTSALQTLPDPTLRWLAASSVGLGAGLYMTGRRRLVVAAGIAPAVVMAVAIALRPSRPTAPRDGTA